MVEKKNVKLFRNDDRIQLSKKNIIILTKLIKKNKKQVNRIYVNNVLLAHSLCEKIEKKIKIFHNYN